MTFFSMTNKNIKFKIIDTETLDEIDEECFMEIIVKRTFLNDFLRNLNKENKPNLYQEISLTKREKQVLYYLSSGINNSQIAQKMNVSIHTAKLHIHNIFNKLSVQDRTEAVVKAIKYNLIDV